MQVIGYHLIEIFQLSRSPDFTQNKTKYTISPGMQEIINEDDSLNRI